jgi:hypothetical protein
MQAIKYTVDYNDKFVNDYDAGVAQFETDFADYLRGAEGEDVGGVVIYYISCDELRSTTTSVGWAL